MNARFVSTAALLAVTVALVYVAMDSYRERSEGTAAAETGLFLPEFRSRVNDTARIVGVNEDGPLTLERVDGVWVVGERGGYRANQAQVNQLLAGLAQLRKLEPKTAKAERYAKIGLDEPGAEGSRSRQYTIEDGSGAVAASIIVGNDKPARGNPSATEYYVRTPGDPQAWLVEGTLPRTSGTVDWLDDALLDLDVNRIRRVEVLRDGSRLTVERDAAAEDGYRLLDIPPGREVENSILVRNVVTGIASFPFEDVAASSPAAKPADPDITIRLTTHDGLVITMTGDREGEDHNMLWFDAEYDASVAEHEAPQGEVTAEGAAPIVRLDEAAVRAEAEALASAWRPWVFEVGNWRIATADKSVDELLKPLAAAPQTGTGQGAGAASPAPAASDG